MINPDNTTRSSSSSSSKNSERASDKPDGKVDPEKFQRVYAPEDKNQDHQDEESEEFKIKKKTGGKASALGGGRGDAHKPVTLFDLAHGEKGGHEGKEGEEQPSMNKNSSLFEMAAPRKRIEPEPVKKAVLIQEETDISSVNPLAINKTDGLAANIVAPVKEAAPPVRTADLQQIIAKIIDRVYTLEEKGRTSSIIEIGEGPFKGASIKITEFDSAKGQLNITIDNIKTQELQTYLDKNSSQLLDSLVKQGYHVQQFITTTAIENPRFDSSKQGQNEQRDGRRENQQDSKQGNKRSR
jgi:hypothetical protein